jgi:hypothetical protein
MLFPTWAWHNLPLEHRVHSSELNLVQRRLCKIAREPSANANLEGAQPEPAGQMGVAEKSKGRDAIFRAHLRRARNKSVPRHSCPSFKDFAERLN